jgi:hypothetical protein
MIGGVTILLGKMFGTEMPTRMTMMIMIVSD